MRFWRTELRALGRTTRDALERLVGGLGTAALALTALFWLLFVAVGCLVGVGLPFVPTALRLQRFAADRERARLSRRGGDEVVSPGPAPARWRDAVADPVVRREWRWLAIHGTYGLVLGILGIVLPVNAVRDGTFPLWWKLLPRRTPRPRSATRSCTTGSAPSACGRSAWPGSRSPSGSAPRWPAPSPAPVAGCCRPARTSTCRCGSPS
ncbi:hypothetical protein Asp14428_08750 [Actinoplanes sp. NBRC 14428]|nr:hypothetical protein Asp14428_08750 [Actinoplanes sp. NBRC 14428]